MRHTFLAAMLYAAVSLAAATSYAGEPQWIWATKDADQSAPVGVCHFRKTFELIEPAAGRIEIACDNRYVLRLNGRLVGASNRWQRLDRYDVSALLKPGENVIDVRCINDEDAAGLVARVVVEEKGKPPADYSTDSSWEARLNVGRSWDPAAINNVKPTPVFELGELGKAAPWGDGMTAAAMVRVGQTPSSAATGPFELKDGDRVVLVGNTLIERAQTYGYLETALTAAWPDRNVVFRNLGWSGDTVFGHARARFGPVSEGFQHLAEHVMAEKPTVIFVGYGSNAAHAGESGLPEFADGLNRLLDMLEHTGARIVLLSPLRHENLGPPLPDPTRQNENVRLYCDAIRRVANERGHRFVDLYKLMSGDRPDDEIVPVAKRLTDNGIHLSAYGYWRLGELLLEGLGVSPPASSITVNVATKEIGAEGATIGDLDVAPHRVRFHATLDRLPYPRDAHPADQPIHTQPGQTLKVVNLGPGNYRLSIDGEPVKTASAEAWSRGVSIEGGPDAAQANKLRQTIVAKNELYFHRWRPQNETYLYLFRKHEQGSNAREIPQFDPLVAEKEAEIQELRAPKERAYVLERAAE